MTGHPYIIDMYEIQRGNETWLKSPNFFLRVNLT